MTLDELSTAIAAAPGETVLRFDFGTEVLGPGYHLTELRHAELSSIDCGYHQETRREAVMQLMLGGRATLTLEKLSGILTAAAIPGDAKIVVEAAPDNASLRLYDVPDLAEQSGDLTLTLAPKRPVCGLAVRTGCC